MPNMLLTRIGEEREGWIGYHRAMLVPSRVKIMVPRLRLLNDHLDKRDTKVIFYYLECAGVH
jgi:hypothetical protein